MRANIDGYWLMEQHGVIITSPDIRDAMFMTNQRFKVFARGYGMANAERQAGRLNLVTEMSYREQMEMNGHETVYKSPVQEMDDDVTPPISGAFVDLNDRAVRLGLREGADDA